MKRLGLYLPALALLILAIGWTVFWFVARSNTSAAIDRWLAAEAASGRVWTCPQRSMTGYPFRLELRCAEPTVAGDFGQGAVVAGLSQFTAFAQIYQPNQIIAEAQGPLVVRPTGGAGAPVLASLGWETFRVSLRGAPGRMERFSAVMEKADFVAASPMKAGRAELHVRRTPPKSGERPAPADRAYDVAVRLADAQDPGLDGFFRSAAPASLFVTATLTQGDDLFADITPLQRVEAWRQAGGRLDLSSLRFSKGPVSLDATGSLGLDEARRLAGQADLTAVGFGPILQAYGISERALTAGGFLGALLGGQAPQPGASPPPPGSLRAPLRFADGRVFFGPVRTPVALRPLY